MLSKSMDWFLYDNGLRHERVKQTEDEGFTVNLNFILFKWRLKRKHFPAKYVIHATEIHRM